jgi:hypothetical protein
LRIMDACPQRVPLTLLSADPPESCD